MERDKQTGAYLQWSEGSLDPKLFMWVGYVELYVGIHPIDNHRYILASIGVNPTLRISTIGNEITHSVSVLFWLKRTLEEMSRCPQMEVIHFEWFMLYYHYVWGSGLHLLKRYCGFFGWRSTVLSWYLVLRAADITGTVSCLSGLCRDITAGTRTSLWCINWMSWGVLGSRVIREPPKRSPRI